MSLLLTIITINFNNLNGLKKTIDSVVSQEFQDFEYIIIDGGSTDGSKNLIEHYNKRLAYWVSEKDGGIYNAMNKGIEKSKGKYLLFLNSGDELYKNNVLSYIRNFKEDLIYFDVYFYNSSSSFVHKYPYKLNFNYFLKYSLPHQATLISRSLFNRVGLYNEQYKICSDWAFFIDAIFKFGASYKKVDKIFAKLDRSGISCDPKNYSWIEMERFNFLQENYTNINLKYIEENFPTKKYNFFSKRGITKLFNNYTK